MLSVYLITAICIFVAGAIFIGFDRTHFTGQNYETMFGLLCVAILWPLLAMVVCVIAPLFCLYILGTYIQDLIENRRE
jgi:hypothetical protein